MEEVRAIHHRGTEDTEKTSLGESQIKSFLFLNLAMSFSVLSVSLW